MVNEARAADGVYGALSDPSKQFWLPFPSLDTIPKRFTRDKQKRFYYEGRQQLQERITEIKDAQSFAEHFVWRGTVGYGKSHMMAAAACVLLAESYNVVYIPDCAKLRSDELVYLKLRDALCVAFADNFDVLHAVYRCNGLDALIKWIRGASCMNPYVENKVVILLDQAHPLLVESEIRHAAVRLIDILEGRCVVRAISTRDQKIAAILESNRNDQDVNCFGGLNDVCETSTHAYILNRVRVKGVAALIWCTSNE